MFIMRGNFFQEAPKHNLGNFTICKFKKFDFSRRGERGPGPPRSANVHHFYEKEYVRQFHRKDICRTSGTNGRSR